MKTKLVGLLEKISLKSCNETLLHIYVPTRLYKVNSRIDSHIKRKNSVSFFLYAQFNAKTRHSLPKVNVTTRTSILPSIFFCSFSRAARHVNVHPKQTPDIALLLYPSGTQLCNLYNSYFMMKPLQVHLLSILIRLKCMSSLYAHVVVFRLLCTYIYVGTCTYMYVYTCMYKI